MKTKKERNQRNLIEGKFGQAKNVYGLGNIKAKRRDTSQSWISAIFFIMNLITLSKIAHKYAVFCAFFEKYTKNIFVKQFKTSKCYMLRFSFKKQHFKYA